MFDFLSKSKKILYVKNNRIKFVIMINIISSLNIKLANMAKNPRTAISKIIKKLEVLLFFKILSPGYLLVTFFVKIKTEITSKIAIRKIVIRNALCEILKL